MGLPDIRLLEINDRGFHARINFQYHRNKALWLIRSVHFEFEDLCLPGLFCHQAPLFFW